MKKHLCFIVLVSVMFWNTAGSIERNGPVAKIMKEEYTVVAKLRHKLKELLERQEFEETLTEGDDAYNSFQNLEQLLQQMESHPNSESMKALMEALKEFESHLSNVLEQQNGLQDQLPTQTSMTQNQQIPLSSLMEALKELLQKGQFQEARQLLNQMLNMFDRQQNQLRQSIAQYNQKKFAKTSQQLTELLQRANQALHQEKQVRELLEEYLKSLELPQNAKDQAIPPQNRVTELAQQMQQLLEQMDASSLLSLEQLKALIQQSRESSQMTMEQIQSGPPQPASQAAQTTQNHLEMIQGQVSSMQQEMQRLLQPQGRSPRKGTGRQRYWSEKGVHPLRFEYRFQVNPAYRKEIQELNQEKHFEMTPRQQQYLQDVIK